MLSPDFLSKAPDSLIELYAHAEQDILADMARRICTYDYFIPAAQWQWQKLQDMGMVRDEIYRRLAQLTGKTEKELVQLVNNAGATALTNDQKAYKAAGLDPLPINSQVLADTLSGAALNSAGLFTNLTRTTANTATGQFENALDRAYMQIATGAFDPNTAIRNTIKQLCEDGIKSITYDSGRTDSLETAVRRAVVTGVNQAALKAQEQYADEMNCDLVEVTAHAGARTGKGVANHAAWQGKIYSRSGTHSKYPSLVEVTGYGTGAGLGGWNCRHSMFPFVEGCSEPVYTQNELDELNEPMYEYNGVKMTEYEATCKQRYIERQIRRYKREAVAFDAAGIDNTESKSKVSQWKIRQRDFINQTGIKRDYSRDKIAGNIQKDVAKSVNHSIIDAYKGKGVPVSSADGISTETISKVKNATQKVTSDFKVLETCSEPISFGDVENGLAENCFDPKIGLNRIALRKADFSNPDLLLQKLKNDYAEGISYDTDSIESLVAHEMGHNAHIALALKRAGISYGRPLSTIERSVFREEYGKIRCEIYGTAFSDESLSEINSICVKELGEKARNNANELIAQSFGNYYYGTQKSVVARKIVKYFMKGLK